jgi:hypothetical protein
MNEDTANSTSNPYLAHVSTKRLLAELERRALAPDNAWTTDQALRVMMLAEMLSVSRSDAELGLKWWNNLTPEQRADWMQVAGSCVPAEAWALFKRGVVP